MCAVADADPVAVPNVFKANTNAGRAVERPRYLLLHLTITVLQEITAGHVARQSEVYLFQRR